MRAAHRSGKKRSSAMNYTSIAVRDRDVWRVQCVEHPSAISVVTRLEDAPTHQREAIAFVLGVPESEVEVEVITVPPDANDADG